MISDVKTILAPFAPFAHRKVAQIASRFRTHEEYNALYRRWRGEIDFEKALKLLDELEALEVKLEKQCGDLAFATKVDQRECMNVAQYHDEWIDTGRGGLRAWYVCFSAREKGTETCGTLIPSKLWPRRFDDPGATKQRWYCACCGAKYKTGFGMLVEFHLKKNNVSTFMLAEISNRDVEDVRAMYLEATLNVKDHKELWTKIPDFYPMNPDDVLRPCVASDFWADVQGPPLDKSKIMKFHDDKKVELMKMEKWNWDDIFAFTDAHGMKGCIDAMGS